MKKLLLVSMITLLGILLDSNVMGQTNQVTQGLSLGMPELNLVSSISPIISLELTTAVAGQAVLSSKSDSTARIKISSVIAEGKTRTLSAKVSVGTVPAGTELKLIAKNPNGSFVGNMGSLGAVAVLSGSDAPIVTSIGSCYSGVADDDGYVLKYTWGLLAGTGSYANVRATTGTSVTVTLTLSAGL